MICSLKDTFKTMLHSIQTSSSYALKRYNLLDKSKKFTTCLGKTKTYTTKKLQQFQMKYFPRCSSHKPNHAIRYEHAACVHLYEHCKFKEKSTHNCYLLACARSRTWQLV